MRAFAFLPGAAWNGVRYKAVSQQLVGCAMEVLNELGHGFHEKPYENALVVEFRLHGIPYEQQRQYDILYKQEKVGIIFRTCWLSGKSS